MKLTKHTIRLREGDFEVIQSFFRKRGANDVVRELVSVFVDTKLNRPVTAKDIAGIEVE